MQLAQVLDVFEGLLAASRHPDIAGLKRYGHDVTPGGGSPAGINVKHASGSEAYLWVAVWPGAKPIPIPDEPLPIRQRAGRLAVFAAQLVDVARPSQFRSWQLVAFSDLGPEPGVSPCGISVVCSDGTTMLLRVTAGGPPTGEAAEDPHPDYRIPEDVTTWQLAAGTANVVPA